MTVTLALSGDLIPDTFCDFIFQRSEALDVDVAILEATGRRIVVRLCGHHDLVGAVEMACELGPHTSVVHDVHRLD